jgi:hypothetical protein
MTITDITPHLRIKRSFEYDRYPAGIQELMDQITCLQKAVANLRKDLSPLIDTARDKDNRFWIHS